MVPGHRLRGPVFVANIQDISAETP